MAYLLSSTVFGAVLICGVAAQGSDSVQSLMAGKVDTGRSIILEATIDAPPEEVFHLWTTADEIPKFFAPKAIIEPRLGGRYEMIFDPQNDPEGDDSGTKGARIVDFQPNRALSFEWTGFTRTGKDPRGPVAWPEQRDHRPIVTWVDLHFEPVAGHPEKTRILLAERGFGTGGKWNDAIQYFWRNWALILGRLGAYCANEHPPVANR